MYGSNFCIVTVRPRSTRSRPSDAAAMPFPREETTPPVTKMYLVALGELVMNRLWRSGPCPAAGDTGGAPALAWDNVSGRRRGSGPRPRVALASTNLIRPAGSVKTHAGRIDNRSVTAKKPSGNGLHEPDTIAPDVFGNVGGS